jgi:hypothetical protein
MEKQRDKAAKRMQRKVSRENPSESGESESGEPASGEPTTTPDESPDPTSAG